MPNEPSTQASARMGVSFTKPLAERTEEELWQGRNLGQLSEAERKEVFRRALSALKSEMESPEFRAALSKES